MLILSRSINETIKIGDDITVTVLGISGNQVKVGISAPRETAVLRQELADPEQPQKSPIIRVRRRRA